jgi:hypothetical protein
MFLRTLFTLTLGCTLLLAPAVATAADRGPSTPEERKQALEYIHDFESNPLGPNAIHEREWVMLWLIEVPDIHVNVCLILDKLPKGNKKDSNTIFAAETFSQAALVLEHPEKQDDLQAQYLAGVNGALDVYQVLVKANPKDQQPYLDDLLQRRTAGTLDQYVKERVAASCGK